MTKQEIVAKIEEITRKAIDDKLKPYLAIMPVSVVEEIFRAGLDAGIECGRYIDYSK